MKLTHAQISKIKNIAQGYEDLSAIVSNDNISFKNETHTITITDLDLTGIQKGVKGYFSAMDMLTGKCKRNHRLENSPLDEVDFIDTNHIKSNPELRFECDFETVSHIKTKNKNSKTLLQDNANNYIFTGNCFDLVIEMLSDSPVRYLKRNYSKLYDCLIEIETNEKRKEGRAI